MQVRITIEHEATRRAEDGTFEEREVIAYGAVTRVRIRPIGIVIEGPDVWKLVSVGLAEPADDECKARFTPEQVARCAEVGHPAIMRMHAEAVAEKRDAAAVAEFVEEDEEEEN